MRTTLSSPISLLALMAFGFVGVDAVKIVQKMTKSPPKEEPPPETTSMPTPPPETTPTPTTPPPPTCEDLGFEESSGMWYKDMEQTTTWQQCETACQAVEGSLVVIHDDATRDAFDSFAFAPATPRAKRGFTPPDPGVWLAFKQTASGSDTYTNGPYDVSIPGKDINMVNGYQNIVTDSGFWDADTADANDCFVVGQLKFWWEESCTDNHRCFCECMN